MMRDLPYNEEDEHALIGAILLGANRVMPLCLSHGLTAQSFYVPACSMAFESAMDMFAQGKFIGQGTMPEVKGIDYEACIDAAVTAAHSEYYIGRIKAQSLRREVITLCTTFGRSVEECTDEDLPSVLAEAQDQLSRAGGPDVDHRQTHQVAADLIAKWRLPIEARSGLAWGLPVFDRVLGQIENDFIMIAARESVGKTAFALQLALVNAQAGHRVGFASLESKREQVVGRLIAQAGQVNTLRLRHGYGMDRDFDKAEQAKATLEGFGDKGISIADHGMTAAQVRAWALMEKARGAKLLIVDNLKHIRAGNTRNKSTVEVFRELSLAMKHLRDDVGLPLVVLHHLNKEGDVAWADDIRRDVDILLIMTRNEQDSIQATSENAWSGRQVVDIEVEKNREGKRGFPVQAHFRVEVQSFEPWPAEANESKGEWE